MKKIIKYSGVLLFCLLSFDMLMAQDIIMLKTGDEIKSRVIEITGDQVKYKRYDNLNGPTYSYGKSEVFKITYENGKMEIITSNNSISTNNVSNNTQNITKAQIKADTLTNEKVIKLSKLGLQPSVIINKIQTSYTLFDVSTDALINLSDNGVSADVINEMMKTESKAQMEIVNQKDINDPKTMRKTGIYLYNPNDNVKPIKRVDPTVTSTTSSGGIGTALAQHFSYGIAKDKLKSSISGSNSRMQINVSNPVFYFYFESNSNPSADNWFFATATSPNEFALVKLVVKNDSREMVVGDANAYGSSSGISNKVKIPFAIEEVSEGIYKVTFNQPLENGEYCFLYASSTPTRYSNDKVFDFGISK